jgi:hypothetical protein
MRQLKLRYAALCLGSALLPLLSWVGHAADSDTVQAKWKPQEVRYSYAAFTTAYSCDAAEDKLENVLKEVGAHPQTKVRATGCNRSRPARNFFITITTAMPVPANEADTAGFGKSEQELLDRMGAKNAIKQEEFPAAWKTIDLSRDRKLDLQPGDCELMEGLRDHVLPKLGVKIVSDKVRCMPKQVDIQTPELKVSALIKAPTADEPKPTGR